MDNCIYHSKDLDGLMSGAIVKHYQTEYWEPCKLHPYDYGENLDTRKFKGKTVVMIDVSMPMDRMELLATSCMEFMWIDHHLSAYNDLLDYCKDKGYEILQRKINDLVLSTEVKKMNLIYYYSPRLSGCELAAIIFNKHLNSASKKVIQLLGQYDTWRQFDDKKFVNDDNWNEVVIPFQYGMRARYNNPESIADFIATLNNFELYQPKNSDLGSHIQNVLDPIIELGKSIVKYQENLDETNMKNNSFEMDFDFEGKSYKAICLNSTVFNSGVFKSIYYDQYHDLMLAFQYCGKTDKYKFSLYTTKEDVNILGIAKSFGGGGHVQACGFELPAVDVSIQKNVISIFNNRKKDPFEKNIGFLEFMEDVDPIDEDVFKDIPEGEVSLPPAPATESPKFKPPKGYLLREDDDGHWYWIPLHLSKKFETGLTLITGKEYMEAPEDFDSFNNQFAIYATGGDPELCPEFLYEKLKDKL